MKSFVSLLVLILVSFSSGFAIAKNSKMKEISEKAISENANVSNEAILELRKMNSDGLEVLLENFEKETLAFENRGERTPKWQRISNAIDSVAMQKDAYSSKLFWFTDLEEAKKQAKIEKKPILSLRLLGNLNEEFSCANSRFFRSILYSNSAISNYLRENFILHWKSVRPAPKVTIDFGDGRKIERTLTGNSIHYILDENGQVLDALPGLYSPPVFLSYLTQTKGLNNLISTEAKETRELTALKYRKKQFDQIVVKRDALINQTGVKLVESKDSTMALDIAPLALSKMVTEASILRDISDGFSKYSPNIALDGWQKLSKDFAANTKLDASSIAFIKRQNRELSSDELQRLISNTENYISLDTTQNEFVFHTQVYSLISSGMYPDLEKLNARIYDKLFKTPNSDKWLGLYSNDIYMALDGNGVNR
jgi:hypothetical protein